MRDERVGVTIKGFEAQWRHLANPENAKMQVWEKIATRPLRQATGSPRSGAGVGVGMLMVSWLYGFMVVDVMVLWL